MPGLVQGPEPVPVVTPPPVDLPPVTDPTGGVEGTGSTDLTSLPPETDQGTVNTADNTDQGSGDDDTTLPEGTITREILSGGLIEVVNNGNNATDSSSLSCS